MGRKLKRLNLFMRRQSHLPVFLVCAAVVLLLFFNDETSLTRSREYDARIAKLKREIKEATDSAAFYRESRHALLTNSEELEQVARESYNMQRPSEDVYVIESGDNNK